MIQNKVNNLVSISILLLYNKMLSGYKRVKLALKMKFQDKTKPKRCDCAMQKNGLMASVRTHRWRHKLMHHN